MKRKAFRQIVGLEPLPENIIERNRLLMFADAHHVLGQMAAAHPSGYSGKIYDVFDNALLRTSHDHKMLQFEMNRLERALEGTGIKPVLLKGAAYVANNLQASKGRRVSDIDILVAEADISAVEQRLHTAGWLPDSETDNDYDQSYYRKWMHELPPLRHQKRGTVIDVHHRLLPRTARYAIDTAALMATSIDLEGRTLRTFDRIGLFIHSAVHAYADGAFDNPARTFIEQYYLFQDMTARERDELVFRAKSVGADKPVAVALWVINAIFQDKMAEKLAENMKKPHVFVLLRWALVAKALDGRAAPFAKLLLFVRSHYLRMPMRLLIPHLARKAIQWRPRSNKPVELPLP